MNVRSRDWCFTLNNYTEDEVSKINEMEIICAYLVYGKEVGESGTPHLQGYIYFANAKTFSKMKKIFPDRTHLEKTMGTPSQASEYCKKDNDYVEFGTLPDKQGKRTDLIEIKDQIVQGKDVEEIMMENPKLYHQYGRTFDKIQDVVKRREKRTTMTKGYWIYGLSGKGKSEMLFKNYDATRHYVWKKQKEWQDGYKQQPIVIIDEFRGQIPFSQMLELCDKHTNCWIERRGKEAIPFVSKCVCITSSLMPRNVYKNLDENDRWEQFDRRYKVIDIQDTRKMLILELELKFL